MKKKKLSLDTLKVKSFVTSFDGKKENAINGGHDVNSAGTCQWTFNCYSEKNEDFTGGFVCGTGQFGACL